MHFNRYDQLKSARPAIGLLLACCWPAIIGLLLAVYRPYIAVCRPYIDHILALYRPALIARFSCDKYLPFVRGEVGEHRRRARSKRSGRIRWVYF